MVDAGVYFDNDMWDAVCDKMYSLFVATSPRELTEQWPEILESEEVVISPQSRRRQSKTSQLSPPPPPPPPTPSTVTKKLWFSPPAVLAKCIIQLQLVNVAGVVVETRSSSFSADHLERWLDMLSSVFSFEYYIFHKKLLNS